ncbi:hypothetical protein DSO57_1009879 [Entomophthora muscae]|nr:hypothetical protein DSO57_1009879 [Entomophthora muscae]
MPLPWFIWEETFEYLSLKQKLALRLASREWLSIISPKFRMPRNFYPKTIPLVYSPNRNGMLCIDLHFSEARLLKKPRLAFY